MTRQAKWLKEHPFYQNLYRLANKGRINKQQKKRYMPSSRHSRYITSAQRNRKIILSFKNSPCTDCGKKYDPFIMHFDHRDPNKKRFMLSKAATYSEKSLREEIAKCDLVCANCHGLRTVAAVKTGKLSIFGRYYR